MALVIACISFSSISPRMASAQGTVGARALILSDTLGHVVKIIPPLTGAPGTWIYEIPVRRITETGYPTLEENVELTNANIAPSQFNGLHGNQKVQSNLDNEPFITFQTGSNNLSNNRVAAAGTGISLSTAGADNGNFTITNSGVISLTGTSNQVSVSAATGSVTLSLPQSINTAATPQFANVNLTGLPASSTFSNIVVSNGGVLQTRTTTSLGFVGGSEPFLTFAVGGSSLTNNRVVTAGNGISIVNGATDNSNFTITNTGVTNVGLSLPNIFDVTTSSVTTAGTLTAGLVSQTANTFFAAPSNGDGNPSFRTITSNDFANISWTMDGNAYSTGQFIGGRDGNHDPLEFRVNNIPSLLLTENQSLQRHSDALVRGYYSVDMQADAPTNDNNIARGDYSVISGGYDNSATGGYSTVSGGSGNTATAFYSTVSGGQGNIASNVRSTVSGGYRNTASARGATVGGGGYDGDAGGNTASGIASTVSGGWSNEASGYYANVSGGQLNTSSAFGSTVGGGSGNYATAEVSTVVGGQDNLASGDRSVIVGGTSNTASGIYSAIAGGYQASTTMFGELAQASGAFANAGDAQRSEFILRRATSDSIPTELYLDGSSSQLNIPNNTVWNFVAHVSSLSSTGDAGAYELKGLIKNIGGTTSIVGSVQVSAIAEDQAAWDVSASADATNNALSINVAGANATDIRWVASVRITQVTY